VPPRPHDLTASLEFSEEAESFHDLLSCAFSPAHLRAPRGEPSAPAMSAEVASGQASTRASAPGVADGPALDSLSLFETTARVTAVSFASARHDDATRRATRKRARASSSPERPHATTSSPAPSRVTREPLSSPRDATARAEPSSRRNGSGDRASTANANANVTRWCALPLLRVDVGEGEASPSPRERVARLGDDASHTDDVERDGLLLESTILSMLTPVARADPAGSF
jgi:hypothetical protein